MIKFETNDIICHKLDSLETDTYIFNRYQVNTKWAWAIATDDWYIASQGINQAPVQIHIVDYVLTKKSLRDRKLKELLKNETE